MIIISCSQGVIAPSMKPALCDGDSSLVKHSTSMSSVFEHALSPYQQPEPVRASTPISFIGDETRLNETPCSVQAPDNISLISEDLSVSLEADSQLTPTETHKTLSLSHMAMHLEL